MPLLTTKLYVPRAGAESVSGPHLTERLNVGLHHNLALVSAPAGFGKTTLVSECLSGLKTTGRAARPFSCLSLNETDNNPARFLIHIVVALQKIDSDIGQAAQAMLQASQPPPPESFLASLINDIAATSHPFVLVLDDYYLIHTLPIHQQLVRD